VINVWMNVILPLRKIRIQNETIEKVPSHYIKSNLEYSRKLTDVSAYADKHYAYGVLLNEEPTKYRLLDRFHRTIANPDIKLKTYFVARPV